MTLSKSSDGPQPRPCSGATRTHELARELTVLVPAYNEVQNISATLRSLQAQTVPLQEIIVIDDGSTDGTGDVARAFGVTVLRPPANTGSKGRALNCGADKVRTELTMTVDADTVLAPDAVERVLHAFDDPAVGAACGFVIPRHVSTIWERGRYIEYLLAFTFYKGIQDLAGKILVASGCFCVYRTSVLRELGGWSARTVSEDLDLTWRFEHAGYRISFVPEAVCFAIDPHNFTLMRRQLRRWTHGFVQAVRAYRGQLLGVPYLRSLVAVVFLEMAFAPVFFFLLLPLLLLATHNPLFLFGYFLDAPAILAPVLYKARARSEVRRALVSFPAYFVLRAVNAYFFYEAIWSELVMRRRLHLFEKGHE